jgi:DNA topoisomerase I
MAGTSKIKGNTKTFVPPKPATAAELRRRWKKKQGQVQTLANNMQKLRYNITSDMKSEDEKVFLTACVVSLMDKSAERVGNDDSASKGHRGITGLLKSQVKIEGNSIHLRYTGKSGVKQEKVVTDERLSNALRKAMGVSKSKYLFCTSDGFKIKNDRVNRYLSDFGITAKDIRGFSANKWLIQKLHANDIADDEKQRKKDFIRMSKAVAAKVGHGHTMLKNQYLIPGLEEEYITNGRIMDIKDIDGFKGGGVVEKMEKGGEIKKKDIASIQSIKYLEFPEDIQTFIFEFLEANNASGKVLDNIDNSIFVIREYSIADISPKITEEILDKQRGVEHALKFSKGKYVPVVFYNGKLVDGFHRAYSEKRYGASTVKGIELADLLNKQKHESGGVIVDSDNFKKWFAASKAIDENGQPAKVYHGTESDPFYTYDKTTVRDKFGFFFTDDKDYAEMFGKAHVPYYLSMQKPYVITQEKWDAIRDAHAKDSVWFENWRNQLIGKGHDGLIVKFSFISFAGTQIRNPEIYAVFESNQVKIADGSNTTFDATNPDVRYADGGITIAEENNDDEEPESTIDMLKRYVEVSRNFDAFTRYLALSEEHEQQAVMDELKLEKATSSEIGLANKKKLEAFYKEQKKEINARRKERKFQVEQIKEQDFLEKITNMALESEAQMQQNIEKYEERKKNAVRIPVSLFEDLPEDKSLKQDYQVPTNLFANKKNYNEHCDFTKYKKGYRLPGRD